MCRFPAAVCSPVGSVQACGGSQSGELAVGTGEEGIRDKEKGMDLAVVTELPGGRDENK